MASGGQAEYPWDGDTVCLTINFACVGIKKKSRFIVQVRLTDSYGDFLNHLKASKGVTGRLVTERELSKGMTLAEAGIRPGAVLEMESYTPAKRFDHKIPVKLPNGTEINVQVHNKSTIGDLKHKIQDEIGMLVEEQSLEYNGRRLNQHKVAVDICGHKKTPPILKWVPSEFNLNYVYKNKTDWIANTSYMVVQTKNKYRQYMQYGLIILGALFVVLQAPSLHS